MPKLLLTRYQGLEQRMKTELQAAATSKEEALRELKKRALQLEEELFQVQLGPGSGPRLTPSSLHADVQGCLGSRPFTAPSGLAPRFLASCWPCALFRGLLEGTRC